MLLSRRTHLATGWLILAIAGLSLHAAHTGLGVGGHELNALFDEWLYNALMLGAAVACLARGVLVRTDRLSWLLLGAGLLSWSAGDLFFSLVLINQAEVPVPSISDGLYLAFYPAACAGLALLVRRNVRELHLSLWIDALMGALAVSAVATAFLYDAVRVGVGGEAARIATTLAYPIGDIALLVFVVGFFALTGWRPGSTWGLIGLALALAGVGDAVFLWQAAHGTYAEGGLLDSVWPASAMLLAISAWRRPKLIEPRLDELRILAMPSLFAAAAMAVLVADQLNPLAPVAVALALGTLIMLIARLAHTLRVNLRMVAASRGEARTDELTGLGNRRKLLLDLERELARATPDHPRVLMLFDLDGFKNYNDSQGHLAGDALLARLGDKLSAAVEPYGRAYRMGGDEFCALLGAADAIRLQTAISVASLALRESGPDFDVRASWGVAELPHEADTADSALQLADQRMYAHKRGRAALDHDMRSAA
jgi:two-component system, cell cycle response regulator